MTHFVTIEKIAEITAVEMLVKASEKDIFSGILTQSGVLPFTFYYGEYPTLTHQCADCGEVVKTEFRYGSSLITLGSLSRQDFNENRPQLDIFGTLFHQFLYNSVDINGFESYLYLTNPERNRGALLDVSYYRCTHCQVQYLVLYQVQLKEERPPFAPDEILIEKIYQVAFDHDELLRVLNKTATTTGA